MTVSPEYRLAREAGMCYAALAVITDYDVWKGELVSVEKVQQTLRENKEKIGQVLRGLVKQDLSYECDCDSALQIQTAKDAISQEDKEKYKLF